MAARDPAGRARHASGDVRWLTFEDAHVAEYPDPPWAERAEAGQELVSMLRSGELDAIIAGNDIPADPMFSAVFPIPILPSKRPKHGFVPVTTG